MSYINLSTIDIQKYNRKSKSGGKRTTARFNSAKVQITENNPGFSTKLVKLTVFNKILEELQGVRSECFLKCT